MKKEFTEGYHSVFFQPGDAPVFCYRSGLTVYEEVFSAGTLNTAGWNASGYPLNVLTNCSTRSTANTATADLSTSLSKAKRKETSPTRLSPFSAAERTQRSGFTPYLTAHR